MHIFTNIRLTSSATRKNLGELKRLFAKCSTLFSGFEGELCAMRICGIYETHTPLVFRAISEIGCTSRVKSLTDASQLTTQQMERVSLFVCACRSDGGQFFRSPLLRCLTFRSTNSQFFTFTRLRRAAAHFSPCSILLPAPHWCTSSIEATLTLQIST